MTRLVGLAALGMLLACCAPASVPTPASTIALPPVLAPSATPMLPSPTPDPVALLRTMALRMEDCLHAAGNSDLGNETASRRLRAARTSIEVSTTNSLTSPYTGSISVSDPEGMIVDWDMMFLVEYNWVPVHSWEYLVDPIPILSAQLAACVPKVSPPAQ